MTIDDFVNLTTLFQISACHTVMCDERLVIPYHRQFTPWSIPCSGAKHSKLICFCWLFVREIHWCPVGFLQKGPVMRETFPWHYVITPHLGVWHDYQQQHIQRFCYCFQKLFENQFILQIWIIPKCWFLSISPFLWKASFCLFTRAMIASIK